MSLYTPYTSKGAGSSSQAGKTEFDILKNSHKFLREDEDGDESRLTWDERLAKKYYSSLYREYAVCDLKHYKSGNFALRWRTEEEVLSGAGDTTCGNTRCPLHKDSSDPMDDIRPKLTTLELPFSYSEHGESKFALVKVVLCEKCVKKLMWKRNKEKQQQMQHTESDEVGTSRRQEAASRDRRQHSKSVDRFADSDDHAHEGHGRRQPTEEPARRRRRNSRSLSPRRRSQERQKPSS